MLSSNCIDILGMRVNMVQMAEVIKTMEEWIIDKSQVNYIVASNAYDAVVSKKNIKVREATNSSNLTVPDGISLVMLLRIYGYPLKKRVYGPDLMLEFLKLAEVKGYSNFFYGSTREILNLLVSNLRVKFPRLNITGSYSPPFRELSSEEDKEVVDMINNASPDVLWVGLGTPKQQLWMYEHKDKLKAPVMVGVGAAFDFLAGTKPQAPRFIRDNGFEWLFRLITEPRRLWKRYIINGSLFVYYIAREVILNLIKVSREEDV